MVKRLFACCWRAIRFYIFNDTDQEDLVKIGQEVAQRKDSILPNSFGIVVQDFSGNDFVSRRVLDDTKYIPDESRQRIILKENLVFGQMINFVQYFADIGGFDAIIGLLSLGTNANEESKDDKQADYS